MVGGFQKKGYWQATTYEISNINSFKTVNINRNNKIFETRAEFFVQGMKAPWDESGGRILLGDNTDCGAVLMRPIRFHCRAVCISVGPLCIYIHIWPYMYLIQTCAKFDLCQTFRVVTKSGEVSVSGLWQIYLASGLIAVTNETLELVMPHFMEIRKL
jgi:hypothetical protein